jgi:hypothetical protein
MQTADKYFKFIKERPALFNGSHNIHTPQALVNELLDKVQLTGNILVMFNIEFIISLIHTYNIDPTTIYFYSDHKNKNKICDQLGIKYINDLETNMKFDVVLANPPYKQGLFRSFMQIILEKLSTDNGIVVLVSPDDTNPRNKKNEKTVPLMKNYGLQEIIPSGHYFDVSVSSPIVTYYFDKSKVHNQKIFNKTLSVEEKLTESIIQKIKAKQSIGTFGHKTVGTPPQKENLTLVKALSTITKNGAVWEDLPMSEVRFVVNGQDYFFVNRFFGMNVKDVAYKGQGPLYISTRIYPIENASVYTEDKFNEIFNIKEIKFLLKVYRGTNTFTKGWSLREIPLIPIGTSDYKSFFGFTDEEEQHIINEL